MTSLERFNASMSYAPTDAVPNWELGAWPQAILRWENEGLPPEKCRGDWFSGLPAWGMDLRVFAPIHFAFLPLFDHEVLEETDEYVVARNALGIVSRALKEGSVGGGRMSMDQYLDHPVHNRAEWEALKKRLDPTSPGRYPAHWDELVAGWRERDRPLVLGHNCGPCGFYWRMREWLGTEELSLAFYDEPAMIADMCEFYADFTIEVTRRARADITFDYFNLNEDLAFKHGPLVSPALFQKFVFPPMKRLIQTLKADGVRFVSLDTDGNPGPLIPLFLEAGVDILWPLEQASEETNPYDLRRKWGRDLRLWGAVDKREIARGPAAIDAHLASLAPLVEEGGFVPHLDHTFPPDISAANFSHYMEQKARLLRGEFGA